MLLYAQPTSRLVRLSIDDVILDGSHVALRLGNPPAPVPEPFAAVLLSYLSQRTCPQTMANPDSRWLFPGRRPGQPMHENTLRIQMRQLGVCGAGRHAAIRHLVLQAPPPVVAKALGYHHKTTTQLAAEGGGTGTAIPRATTTGNHRPQLAATGIGPGRHKSQHHCSVP